MASHPIRVAGNSRVPLGGEGVFTFTVKENGIAEEPSTVQAIWRNHLGAIISDETRTLTDVADTATDGGAITIKDVAGDGRFSVSYTPPNNGTYTLTSSGLQFSVQVIVVDEDGTADTGAIAFFIVPSDITITDRSTIMDKIRRRAGILEELFPTLKPGQEAVDLGKGGVYELPLVTKNGSVLTLNTHYTWRTYGSYLTLMSPALDGDEMYIQAQRIFSNEYVEDLISEAESMLVYPALKPLYPIEDLVSSPTVEAMLIAYTVGRLRQDKSKGATLEDPVYRSGWELIRMVQDILKSIQSGATGVCAANGEELATKEGAFVGGFIHPDGAVNGRLTAVDRAQRWVANIEYFWPETPPDMVLDIRRIRA